MKQNKRVQLDVYVEFDSTIDDIISKLQQWKKEYKNQYDSLHIVAEAQYEGGYNHYLVGYRLETDEEEKVRTERENEYKQRQLEYQRAEYEKLKALFEQKIKDRAENNEN